MDRNVSWLELCSMYFTYVWPWWLKLFISTATVVRLVPLDLVIIISILWSYELGWLGEFKPDVQGSHLLF